MSLEQSRLSHLLTGYFNNSCSRQELEELYRFFGTAGQEQLQHILDEEYAHIPAGAIANEVDWDHVYNNILSAKPVSPVHRIHFLKAAWFRYAAAVIAIVAISSYLWWSNQHSSSSITSNNTKQVNSGVGIMQGSNKATLTLADGRKITLDNTANGTVAQQGNAQVIKLTNGQLTYQLNDGACKETMLNTMTTPRGSQYKIQLPDGTNVWLNAASSITYPTAFTGKKREVMVNGEAYFEVKANKSQPFLVKTKTIDINVLGTSFNVHAYENEIAKASLLEGSIKVNGQLLIPGRAYINGKIVTTDLEQDIAWKNGIFNFNHLSLQQVMNQLANWYDLEIIYEGKLPQVDFYGSLWRSVPLNEILQGLSGMAEGIQFRAEGKKLVVSVP